MNIFDIAKGHINNLAGINNEISENRMKICYSCPLYTPKFGGMCNDRLWLNVNTGDVSVRDEIGYKKGCGCVLSAKTRLPNAKCPVGKW